MGNFTIFQPHHPYSLFMVVPGNGNDQNFQGGGYFRKIFGQGGILPEVSNFDRKSRFLALLSHN